ncbi:MAG: PqqD family peptide modification chaperone [Candidatus Helarchaeota archaeon]|nr:PqqD family peptide modification chaperone [Candidatus Helarchaeota archaeon]
MSVSWERPGISPYSFNKREIDNDHEQVSFSMKELTITSTVSAATNQTSCELEGEVVILSLKNGIYYTLNPVGTRIWTLVQKPIQVEEIRDILLKEYAVDSGKCENELFTLLQELEKEGLIEVVDNKTQ